MSVSKKDLGEEHGEIRNLGSPILSKIQQAFLYIKTFATAKANDDFTSVRAVEGMSHTNYISTNKDCRAALRSGALSGGFTSCFIYRSS